jgi:hypothetical protein
MTTKKSKVTKVAVLSSAEVKNNINLNLNQDDLIQIMLFEKIENCEASLVILQEQYNAKRDEISVFEKKFHTDTALLLVSSSESSKGFDKFLKALRVLGLNKEDLKIDGSVNSIYGAEQVVIGNVFKINIDSLEDRYDGALNGSNYMRRVSAKRQEEIISYCKKDRISAIFSGKTLEGIDITYTLHNVDLPVGIQKMYAKFMAVLKKEMFDIMELLYNTQVELLNYKYGEKRIKAKLIRTSLQQSVEGKQILEMMNGITSLKMLS